MDIPVEQDWTIPGELGDLTRPFKDLPDRHREVLWLTVVLGLSTAEAGAVMGSTPGATAVLAHRARAALRKSCPAVAA